jgi:curved DNA-binding protein CbpA
VTLDKALTADKNKALADALMDYYSAPGRFALNLRQPMVVFQQFDKVINWAQGKIDAEHDALGGALQKTAIFFVLRACFRIENSHYDILGLLPDFTPEELRQRYRSLISLTHPDKNITGLPSNAAVRINKAYDTLRNVEERANYDALLSNKIEISIRTSPSSNNGFSLNSVSLKERVQPYLPYINKTIFLVVPGLFTLFVVVFFSFGSDPRDLELVEKKSNSKKNSNASNLESVSSDLAFGTSIESRVATQNIEKTENKDLLTSPANVFEPISKVYRTIVRGVKPDNHQNTQNNVVQNVLPINAAETGVQLNPELSISSMTLKSSAAMTASLLPVVELNASRQNNPNNVEVKVDPLPAASQLSEARANLTQLISALERPSEIEFLQSQMTRKGVSGNLYGIVLPQVRDAAVVRVDHFAFREKLDKNHLVLNGSVAFMLATHSGQLTPYRYAVYAEFMSVDKSSAVSRFELREVR